MAHPKQLGLLRTKLATGNHKELSGNQKLGSGWLTRLFPTQDHSVKAGGEWLFYLIYRKSRKMKKQGSMFQTKNKTHIQKQTLIIK